MKGHRMSKEDDTFRKVMEGLKNQKGLTQEQIRERARKIVQGEAQNKKFKDAQVRAKKLRDKKRRGGDDGVVDSGQFSS